MADRITLTVEDDGSLRRLSMESPKILRELLKDVVNKTRFSLEGRIRIKAPVGPDAPHIKDAVTSKVLRGGITAYVGYIDATEHASPDNPATQAFVALLNEYHHNRSNPPFMRPAAQAEAPDFVRRATDALNQLERHLGHGVGV
jgi:hypothetical protein